MKIETHATFQPLMACTGAQNSSTVTSESGMAAYCMNGMRRPRGFLLRSEREAISGSVTASKMRETAVIRPRMVSTPKMIKPGLMNCVAPDSISPLVGR